MSRDSESASDFDENIHTQSLEVSNFLDDPDWPFAVLANLTNELCDVSESNTQDLLACGQDLLHSLRERTLDPESVRPKLSLGREWRRLYTDASLMSALDTLTGRRRECYGTNLEIMPSPKDWEQVVRSIDLAIVLAGVPGEGRLDLAHSCIAYIQHLHLPLPPPSPQLRISSSNIVNFRKTPNLMGSVPRINPSPSLSAFPALAQRPFILPGFAKDWPATDNWKSTSYLRSCAGRGRIVPVERGGDYRDENWEVDLIPWEAFLDGVGWGKGQTEELGGPQMIDDDNANTQESPDSDGLYLAQHSLFTQFPKLRADILVPDYVYTSPGAHAARPELYTGPPGNDEQLVINAWCGGRGANSPAHTDPYYNIYVQVVGFKSIWLAPPEASAGMYAFSHAPSNLTNQGGFDLTELEGDSREEDTRKKDPKRDGMMGNTSSLDAFVLSRSPPASSDGQSSPDPSRIYPLFYEHALPLAQSTVLSPGDALIIPPGWWHAMRGVGGGSFSVSFWF